MRDSSNLPPGDQKPQAAPEAGRGDAAQEVLAAPGRMPRGLECPAASNAIINKPWIPK